MLAAMVNRIITTQDRKKANRLKRLWNARKEDLGLTQVIAARTLQITQPSFSQYLNCVIPLNTDIILKFAKLLGVDPTEIDPALKNVTSTENTQLKAEIKRLQEILDAKGIRH